MNESAWFRVTLKATASGPRRRILDLGAAGRARFNLYQDDPEAEDAPSKRLRLPERTARELAAQTATWEVGEAEAPESTGLGRQLTARGPRRRQGRPAKAKVSAASKPRKPKQSSRPTDEETGDAA